MTFNLVYHLKAIYELYSWYSRVYKREWLSGAALSLSIYNRCLDVEQLRKKIHHCPLDFSFFPFFLKRHPSSPAAAHRSPKGDWKKETLLRCASWETWQRLLACVSESLVAGQLAQWSVLRLMFLPPIDAQVMEDLVIHRWKEKEYFPYAFFFLQMSIKKHWYLKLV